MVALILVVQGCLAEEKVTMKTQVAQSPVTETVKEPVSLKNATMTANESITNLTAAIGDTILISLKENPTTGYTWNVTNSSGLELTGDSFEMDTVKEGMAGAGGVHSWMVRTVAAGNQSFSGIYKRSWESDSPDDERYNLAVSVR